MHHSFPTQRSSDLLWPLERITGMLSDLAALAIDSAMAVLLREAAADGDLVLADPADPCRGSGFVALGMGKLGARELNYSSDRSEEHTSELQSLMRMSYAVVCLKKKKKTNIT